MKNTTTIEIDLDVYKTIVNYSKFIDEPANEVLRRLLKLDNGADNFTTKKNNANQNEGFVFKGVFLRNNLKLRKHLKGKTLMAEVVDGFIVYDNKKYLSPSGAGVGAAGSAVNGWKFWDFLDENDNSWKSLESLRKK